MGVVVNVAEVEGVVVKGVEIGEGEMVCMVFEFVCVQYLTLKVLSRYLIFCLSYKGSLIKWLTCQMRESKESRE